MVAFSPPFPISGKVSLFHSKAPSPPTCYRPIEASLRGVLFPLPRATLAFFGALSALQSHVFALYQPPFFFPTATIWEIQHIWMSRLHISAILVENDHIISMSFTWYGTAFGDQLPGSMQMLNRKSNIYNKCFIPRAWAGTWSCLFRVWRTLNVDTGHSCPARRYDPNHDLIVTFT